MSDKRNYAAWKRKLHPDAMQRQAVFDAISTDWQTVHEIAANIGKPFNAVNISLSHICRDQWNVQRWERIGHPTMYRKQGGAQ